MNGTITTVLGNDTPEPPNVNLPASQSPAGNPNGLTVDQQGNLYVGTEGRLVKIDKDGKMTLFAGGGSSLADGVKATSALFKNIRDLAFDGSGNLYVVDSLLNVVRKISVEGLITTVAGTVEPSEETFSGDGGPAVKAHLDGPRGIALDALGNLFITDYNNARIRKVALNGVITTVAGKGDAFGAVNDDGPTVNAAMQPYKLAMDNAGRIYFSDLLAMTIRVITPDGMVKRYGWVSAWA